MKRIQLWMRFLIKINPLVQLVFDDNFSSVRVIFHRKLYRDQVKIHQKCFSIHFLFRYTIQKTLEMTFVIITPNGLK